MKKNNLKKTVVAVTFATLLSSGSMNTTFASVDDSLTKLDTITHTFNVKGHEITVSADPSIGINGNKGKYNVDLDTVIDIEGLHKIIKSNLNKTWKYSECGRQLYTKNTSLTATSNGDLKVSLDGQGKIITCIKGPVTHTEVKDWGLLGKHRVPVVRKGIIARVPVSQSINIQGVIRPIIKGDLVTASVSISRAMPSGVIKQFVKVFGLHGKVKKLIQKEIDKELSKTNAKFKLPPEFKQYNVNIKEAKFVQMQNGHLGIKLAASGSITQQQLADLINKEISK